MLVLMVRNEACILARCLSAALLFVDAVLLADTGSEDDTVAIAQDRVRQSHLPLKVVEHPWRDFGHNRTLSLQAARSFADELGWSRWKTHALVLDADMILQGSSGALRLFLDELEEGVAGATLRQAHGPLEYYNVRLMRLDLPWFCKGVTHEYWTGTAGEPARIPGEQVWIRDVGDGGSKGDKFQRDERLLLQGLKDEPTNERYMFYLAQTYHCMERDAEAIEWYTRRVGAGGWIEEVWYAHLMLARTHLRREEPFLAEQWVSRGLGVQPDRIEGLLSLITYFREKSQHFKAWHYVRLAQGMQKPEGARLFLETDAYDHRLSYEKTILHYYVFPAQQAEGAMLSLNYDGPLEASVLSNLFFYAPAAPASCWQKLSFPVPEPYVSSSVAVAADGMLCVRTVSYRISPEGCYHLHNGLVETRNFQARWDFEARTWSNWSELVPDAASAQRWQRDNDIRGLEDVRVLGVQFTATTREFSYCDANRIVHGRFPEMTFAPVRPPDEETSCEKNWLPVGDDRVIYAWYPLRIGAVRADLAEGGASTLQIQQTHNTPRWFRHLRGSAPPVELEDGLWVLTHVVCPRSPRHYLHLWVLLSKEDLRPLAYTPPFYFRHRGIEYCLGAAASRDRASFCLFVSVWDRESWYGEAPVCRFRDLLTYL